MVNRRKALAQLSLLVGGTLSFPTLQAMSRLEQGETNKLQIGLALNAEQQAVVAEVAELIIPKTDTPGAIDAGVPAFVTMMIQDCYQQPEHESFMAGVQQLQKANFMAQSASQKVETLKQIEQDTKKLMQAYQVQQSKMGDNEDKELMKTQATGLPFWRLMKELTLIGYFTSEPGLKASFEYVPIPGKFELIKLKPNQKLYAY